MNSMNKKITIGIDGFSSTGKSTVAKQLAKELGYIYVDTGAMYRAVTLFALRNDLIRGQEVDSSSLIERLPEVEIKFIYNPASGIGEMYLNGENVEAEIRQMQVSNHVSQVASISEVRKVLVEQQQKMGEAKGVVMDGRDIGTVVFPNAELKIFMTASPEERAKRRYEELQGKNQEVSFQEVLRNVQQRDHLDTTREDSPLKKADDAIEIDNTNLSRDEQFQRILDLSKDAGA